MRLLYGCAGSESAMSHKILHDQKPLLLHDCGVPSSSTALKQGPNMTGKYILVVTHKTVTVHAEQERISGKVPKI